MSVLRSNRLKCLVSLLAVGAAVLLQATGGEKIQISDAPDRQEIPSKSLGNDPFEKLELFNSSGKMDRGSFMPTVPPPALPNKSRKTKGEDDWIFKTPETVDEEAVLKEIFKIRDYDPEVRDKKQKTAAERFFTSDEPDHKGQSRNGRRKDDKFDRDESGLAKPYKSPLSRTEDDELAASEPIPELNLKDLLRPNQSAEYLSKFSIDANGRPTHSLTLPQLMGSALPGGTGRTKEQELRLQEFERSLPGRKVLSNPLTDPVNLQPDSTRMAVNPVVGRRTDDYSVDNSRSGAVDPLAGFPGRPPGARPSMVEPFNPKALGLSAGVTAAPLAPRSSPIMQAKPPVLEIPRRAF